MALHNQSFIDFPLKLPLAAYNKQALQTAFITALQNWKIWKMLKL